MRKTMKRGFTLAEVLVTVTVVAVIAAVVLPAVVRQATAGDPARLAQDLVTIKSAIPIFSQNVRPRMPGDIEDLINPISTSDSGADGTPYTSTQTPFWLGPYIEWTTPSDIAPTDVILRSAAGATIINALYRCPGADTYADAGLGAGQGEDAPCTIASDPTDNHLSGLYLSVKVLGIPFDTDQFDALNTIIDGAEGTSPLGLDNGLLRQNASGTVFFLAVPYTAP